MRCKLIYDMKKMNIECFVLCQSMYPIDGKDILEIILM